MLAVAIYSISCITQHQAEEEREEERKRERCKSWVRNEKCASVLIKVNELATKRAFNGMFFVVAALLAIRLQYIYLDMTATFLTQVLNIYKGISVYKSIQKQKPHVSNKFLCLNYNMSLFM